MSRKSKLLGPDGKPLNRAKYAPKPETKATVVGVDVSADVKDVSVIMYDHLFAEMTKANPYRLAFGSTRKPKTRALADRVADDVTALTADFDGESRPELPVPTPDLTAYADAYEHAVKTCPHGEVEDTIHSRGEYQCVECGRYLSRDDMRKRARNNPFGWMR